MSYQAPPVIDLLHQYGVKATKRRSQNFLLDESVYEQMLNVAELANERVVLEIGPGLGTLTERLAPHAKKIIAVEIDVKLANISRDRLKRFKNITIVRDDILVYPVASFGVVPPYQVVANIPYNITSLILKKFLSQDEQPTSMTLLMQREVARRVTAEPGDMSLLALSVQLYGEPKMCGVVPRTAFSPIPAVDSAILHIKHIHPFPFTTVTEGVFWRVAKIGFSAKRKQLKNSLTAGLQLVAGEAVSLLAEANIELKARAEDLSVEDWRKLTEVVEKK